MAEMLNLERLNKELIALKREVQSIKQQIINIEIIMTPEEEIKLGKAIEEHNNKKTVRLEDFKRELGS